MNFMQQAEQSTLDTLAHLHGWGDIFHRAIDDMHRINQTMPSATGTEKKAKFLANAKVIGIDVLMPVGGRLLDTFINLALLYVDAKYPVVGAIATPIVVGIEGAANTQEGN